MKWKIFIGILIGSTQVGCNYQVSGDKSEKNKMANNEIQGVWKLIELKVVQDGDTTLLGQNSIEQYKIYSQNHYIWNREVPRDSAEWHGYGTYELQGDTLVETPVISSGAMQNFLEVSGMKRFEIRMELEKDHFRQIIYNPISKLYNIQRYQRIE